MSESVRAHVNGVETVLRLAPNELLLDVLRENLGLLSVKRSCELSVCGSCTVLIDDLPYSSCMTLAVEMDGRRVTTTEGASVQGVLSDVQQAFIDEGAIQCGFCTPGFVMACHALFAHDERATREEITHYLEGNLCRCTGYASILAAVERVRDARSTGDSESKGSGS